MKDRNNRWRVSSVATSILFAIGAIPFYYLGDILRPLIYGTTGFTFLVIEFGQMRVS